MSFNLLLMFTLRTWSWPSTWSPSISTLKDWSMKVASSKPLGRPCLASIDVSGAGADRGRGKGTSGGGVGERSSEGADLFSSGSSACSGSGISSAAMVPSEGLMSIPILVATSLLAFRSSFLWRLSRFSLFSFCFFSLSPSTWASVRASDPVPVSSSSNVWLPSFGCWAESTFWNMVDCLRASKTGSGFQSLFFGAAALLAFWIFLLFSVFFLSLLFWDSGFNACQRMPIISSYQILDWPYFSFLEVPIYRSRQPYSVKDENCRQTLNGYQT